MTQQDLDLVIGIIIAGFAVPSLMGAWIDRRRPFVGLLALVGGCGLIALAYVQSSEGYTLAEVPEAFIRVIAYYFR